MIQSVIDALRKDGDAGKEYDALLSHVRGLVKMSRSFMSRFYKDWDHQDLVYHGERWPDADDKEQSIKGKPMKMVVPHTYAQVHTFSSFLFLLFNQNPTFYELNPGGDSDFGTKRHDCEHVLERDLRKNQWNRLLFQHLTDLGRFGPAILECSWERQLTRAYVTPEPVMVNYAGQQVEVRPGSEWTEFVKYEGNRLRCTSPYRFFPDTRFPLVDFQRGEFCASEEEFSMGQLRDMEEAGEVAGVDKIRPFGRNWMDARGGETRTVLEMNGNGSNNQGWFGTQTSQSEGTALVTKVQVRIVPSKFKVDGDTKLGPEEHQVLYHIWYANDATIIKCEPAYAWHDQFSYTVAQFSPDMHRTVNLGLADLIYRLQDVITWHINSRITDVRRNMRGRNIVDPFGIETKSLDGDGDIYIRKGAAKAGIDRFIKQLNVTDVTQGHLADADILGKLMQVVTGVNDNAMGQYNSGRRSAQEARTVTAGAAGRMKMHGQLIWEGSLGPMGQMMLMNERQSMSFESFSRMVGPLLDDPPVAGPPIIDPTTGQPAIDPNTGQPIPPQMFPGQFTADQKIQNRYTDFKGTPESVICGDDYMVFDSTLSSEKGFMAQSLSELLAVLLSNPQAAVQFDIDPKAVLDEQQELRTGSSTSRFSFAARKAKGQPQVLPTPTIESVFRPGGQVNPSTIPS